jgi:hypothetical protein
MRQDLLLASGDRAAAAATLQQDALMQAQFAGGA